MLYRQYKLYDEQLELMIPTTFAPVEHLFQDYLWITTDKDYVFSVNRGTKDLSAEELFTRLQDYYLDYQYMVPDFVCLQIRQEKIHRQEYAIMEYETIVRGYSLIHILMLGSFQGKELQVSLQGRKENAKEQLHVMRNVAESLKQIRI